MREVHEALVELLVECKSTGTLPADIWRAGFGPDARAYSRDATELGEIAWRLIGWQIGLSWKTVRAKAATDRQDCP